MLKRLINQAIIHLEITPRDPLLIKSGQPTLSGAKLAFVRSYRFPEYPKEGWAYLPGSSLKGVLRSFAEKVCRTLRPTPTPVCLPYQDPEDDDRKTNQDSCGLILEDCKKRNDITSFPSADVYRISCPICRLFGSHGFTGRLSVSDAYAQKEPKLEIRDGVAIDRFTGGTVPGHIFTSEVLTEGTFCATLEVRNYERWMLGLLSLILEEMADEDFGQITLGSGKSRGLGRFLGIVHKFQLVYYLKPPAQFTGLYGLCQHCPVRKLHDNR
ncbi:MAG: RAMP superfamily CRISPR-associated protein [Candidatus Diapherotrites archaeon]